MKKNLIIATIVLTLCGCSQEYEWTFSHGEAKAGDQPKQILKGSDGFYLLGSYLRKRGESPYVLVKLSDEGEMLWELTADDYLKPSETNNEVILRKMAQVSTDKLFIIGKQTDQNEVSSAFLIKVNKEGKIEDELSIRTLNSFDFIQELNGRIVVLSAGINASTPTLLLYNEKLENQLQKKISFKGNGTTSNNLMKVYEDHIYLVQSKVSISSEGSSVSIIKLNSDGETVWDKVFYESDFENIKSKTGLTYNFVAGALHFSDDSMYIIGYNRLKNYSHFFSIDITSGELVSENLTMADLNDVRNCSESNILLTRSPSQIIGNGTTSKTIFAAIDKISQETCYCSITGINFPISDFYFNENDSIFAGYELQDGYKSNWKVVKKQQDLPGK